MLVEMVGVEQREKKCQMKIDISKYRDGHSNSLNQ